MDVEGLRGGPKARQEPDPGSDTAFDRACLRSDSLRAPAYWGLAAGLGSHHIAWLARNKHRSAARLKDKLAQGFDVHHIDGCHDNDDPMNVVLVDVGDHAMLHEAPFLLKRVRASGALIDESRRRGEAVGRRAYELRLEYRIGWKAVAAMLREAAHRVQPLAREYAVKNGLRWPIRAKRHTQATAVWESEGGA